MIEFWGRGIFTNRAWLPTSNELSKNRDLFQVFAYSGGSKTELGKPNTIRKPNVLKFGFRMVRFSNHHSKSEHSKWPLQPRLFYTIERKQLYI